MRVSRKLTFSRECFVSGVERYINLGGHFDIRKDIIGRVVCNVCLRDGAKKPEKRHWVGESEINNGA